MVTPSKPLLSLTARDLMTPAVLALPQEMRLVTAARMLRCQHVSGAPVVDQNGRCIGVLSTTDFMHFAEETGGPGRKPCSCSDALGMEWEMYEPGDAADSEIGSYMTRDPVTVGPDAGIRQMARMMLDGHIHRLIVVDEERRPVGVVSTTDLLAAVAHAEHSQP